MCEKYIELKPEAINFVLYNLIFSEYNRNFTVPQLVDELNHDYKMNVTLSLIQSKVNEYVKSGLVYRDKTCYTTAI